VRTERAAVTPPTVQRKSAGMSWNTGWRPMTTDKIIAAIMETRPLKRTVIIIAMNGKKMISGCSG
jgi:hypothetical protein